MSEAMAPSVGSIGTSVAVGSSVGAGSSMSGEFSASGIGFDGGSPSFSGLGRSDTGLGSFSVNEGPVGPVSFSNSTDLFSETRSFVGSIGSIPEGPVTGNIFSKDMATLATNPNIEATQSSIFAETSPFQAAMPINERPAPMPSFGEFTTIASVPEPSLKFGIEPEQESTASIEAVVATETAEMGLAELDVTTAIEDLKTNDLLTYMQFKSDLKSVQRIVDIVDEVTDPETAASISNIAISTAVERSGLVQALEKVSQEPEAETEPDTEPSVEPMNANVQAIMEAVNPPVEEVTVEPKQEQPEVEFFVDEDANEARRTETAQAIKVAFEEDIDPETGKVKGRAVVSKLEPKPPAKATSKIVLKEGGRNDGSESQRRNHFSLLEFNSEEEAFAANERLIAENNAVTDEEAVKRATIAEAAKVKSGVKTNIGEIEIYPLAA